MSQHSNGDSTRRSKMVYFESHLSLFPMSVEWLVTTNGQVQNRQHITVTRCHYFRLEGSARTKLSKRSRGDLSPFCMTMSNARMASLSLSFTCKPAQSLITRDRLIAASCCSIGAYSVFGHEHLGKTFTQTALSPYLLFEFFHFPKKLRYHAVVATASFLLRQMRTFNISWHMRLSPHSIANECQVAKHKETQSP